MTPIKLNKTSQIVEVLPDIVIGDLENRLSEDGFTMGYLPLSGSAQILAACLEHREPNLFALKYGGIEDLVVGGNIRLSEGTLFSSKVYPRAATGPDLRRAAIGSKGLLGRYSVATLRVFPLAEKTAWCLVLCDRKDEAVEMLRLIYGAFIRPLFAVVLTEEESGPVLKKLKVVETDKVVLALKLSGLTAMVDAEGEAVSRLVAGKVRIFHLITRHGDSDVLDKDLINGTHFTRMQMLYPTFFGEKPGMESGRMEKKLIQFFKENPC